jgi:hypothetical protein
VRDGELLRLRLWHGDDRLGVDGDGKLGAFDRRDGTLRTEERLWTALLVR